MSDEEKKPDPDAVLNWKDQPLTVGYLESVISDYEKRFSRIEEDLNDGEYHKGAAHAMAYCLRCMLAAHYDREFPGDFWHAVDLEWD